MMKAKETFLESNDAALRLIEAAQGVGFKEVFKHEKSSKQVIPEETFQWFYCDKLFHIPKIWQHHITIHTVHLLQKR